MSVQTKSFGPTYINWKPFVDGDAGWGFLVGVPSFAGEVPGWVPVRKTRDVNLSANRLANRQKWGECTSWTPRMFAQGRQACIPYIAPINQRMGKKKKK
jgi:hypothetical protein